MRITTRGETLTKSPTCAVVPRIPDAVFLRPALRFVVSLSAPVEVTLCTAIPRNVLSSLFDVSDLPRAWITVILTQPVNDIGKDIVAKVNVKKRLKFHRCENSGEKTYKCSHCGQEL
jgi:hypothetical protein